MYGSVGEEVAVLVDGGMEAGRKSVDFNGNGLASGRCFYRMTAGGFTESRKMVLVRLHPAWGRDQDCPILAHRNILEVVPDHMLEPLRHLGADVVPGPAVV